MNFTSIVFNVILMAFVSISLTKSFSISRRKRAAYDLPDGWDQLRDSITHNFVCADNGYFADVDNGCQVFHVCQFVQLSHSKPRFLHHSFICGNGTVFNQLTQTCTYESQLSVPCESSPELYYMNKRIGELNTWFHSSEDFQRIRSVNNNNKFNEILSNAQNTPRLPLSNQLDQDDNSFDSFEDF